MDLNKSSYIEDIQKTIFIIEKYKVLYIRSRNINVEYELSNRRKSKQVNEGTRSKGQFWR